MFANVEEMSFSRNVRPPGRPIKLKEIMSLSYLVKIGVPISLLTLQVKVQKMISKVYGKPSSMHPICPAKMHARSVVI